MKKLVWLQIAIVCVIVVSLCQMSYSQSHIAPFPASSSAEFGNNKAAPPSPGVRADGANKFWITIEDMTYVIGNTNERIVVPKGFVTDFASIPEKLWSWGLSPHGRYSRAAIVHDYLYWSQGCARAQADRLLVIAMKESIVDDFDESVIYLVPCNILSFVFRESMIFWRQLNEGGRHATKISSNTDGGGTQR
ncbi:MAG: DUF1353 domain-containing protein, partial [Syntrophales bacterium]|nr:DUF1353 domain-containing protein [Syntrophales bacterium]